MSYLFNTPEQTREMLAEMGVDSIDALFEQIPNELRLDRPLDLPEPASEARLERETIRLAGLNGGVSSRTCFLGGGAYDHFVPAVVDEVAGRGEFYTAYTPYQAEASQGSLQAFFEYQSLMCELSGLEVSNASLYEGGTAVSEAVFMAMRVTRRHGKVVLLGSVNPQYREVVRTYLTHHECEVVTVPAKDGAVDPAEVEAAVDDQTACVVVQSPNFYGCLEDVEAVSAAAREAGALSIVSFDPLSTGILKRPGDLGADVAVAEGQPLGIPLQYGGPYLGILTCREKFVRRMPGRLIGETVDRNGKRCFVLNMQAREQHIRREKATSNICTNQGLLALRATVYLSLLGPQGLREVAENCCRTSHYAAERLADVEGVTLAFERPFFKEFVIRSERGADWLVDRAREAGCDIGPRLSAADPEANGAGDGVLVAVTEKRTRDDVDELVAALSKSRGEDS